MFQKVTIIAEAGVNHNGSLDIAFQLVDAAAEAGVDYVKFQTFKAEKIASKHAAKADYQKKEEQDESQLQMLKKLELSEDDHFQLIEYCKQKKVNFLSTAFDKDSIHFLKSIGVSIGKIPSGEITNLPYLREAATCFEEIILSTGMATLDEIQDAIAVFKTKGFNNEQLTVLHCNTDYPTKFEDVNLRAMETIRSRFNVNIGYSDHTLGIEVPIAAVALGAVVIEKHFTLDRNLEGPDHAASLEPAELKQMVAGIRHIEKALGSGQKVASVSEEKNIPIVRKSIVALRDIAKGEIFSEENITTKRPGTGISPMQWDAVIGQTAKQDFMTDELISL